VIADYATYTLVTGDVFTDPVTVAAALERAQQRVEGMTGRKLEQGAYTESLAQRDGLVWPSATPVVSVSLPDSAAVAENGISITVTSSNWLSDPTLVPFLSNQPTSYLLVTYVGGYASAADAPVELIDCICELAQRYCLPANTAAIPAGATSVSVNGQAFSGAQLGGASSIPPALKKRIHAFDHIDKRMAD
jgi:hypothetical protein